jgi:chromosome segregation ATPase
LIELQIGLIITASVHEETTRNLVVSHSFEERVFARFDVIDVRFNNVDSRLEKLESRSYDTKPLWERALKEILETQRALSELNLKIDTLAERIGSLEERVGALEGRVGTIESQLADFRKESAENHSYLLRHFQRHFDPVFELLSVTHEQLRQSQKRLQSLESKMPHSDTLTP